MQKTDGRVRTSGQRGKRSEEKKREEEKAEENVVGFPQTSEQGKISTNASNRMVIVMVASHACVIWAINLAVYKRARERDGQRTYGEGNLCLFCNYYDSVPPYNQF